MKKTTTIKQEKARAYPASAFKQWLGLLERDLPKFFKRKSLASVSACPGCRSRKTKPAFKKFGFTYYRCAACDSLYVSPRPKQDLIYDFFKNSKATNHWYNKVFLPSLPSRTVNTIDPLARWAGSIIRRFAPNATKVLDYRPWAYSIVVRKDFPIRAKPFFYKPLYVESSGATEVHTLSGTYDVITAFDDADRESDVPAFFSALSKLQKEGGLLFLTANTASGFEYQVLGEHSPRLVIPDRLNLLSIEAIKGLLEKNGYAILDISTPNKLDVEFVREQLQTNPKVKAPGFLKYLFTRRDESVLQSFQDFLQLNHLTSYCRIAARKIR